MAELFFFLTAIVAIAGAIGVVALRNPFYSVLALVCHLLALAGLFLLLRAEFVAFAQVIVYAGAVMVLYVFVVGYIGNAAEQMKPLGGPSQRGVALVFATLVFVELAIAILGSSLQALGSEGGGGAGFGSPEQIGELLLTDFLFAFEAASILLLIAAVGAVVLARRRGGIHDEPQRIAVSDFLLPPGVGTMAEAVGGRDGRPNPALAPRRDGESEREREQIESGRE